MSADETLVLLLSGVIALITWGVWYRSLFRVPRLGLHAAPRRRLVLVPPACAALLYLVLKLAAASDVRDSDVYLPFYMLVGAAFVGAGTLLPRLFGLSARDDVVERGNDSAALAVGGALVGLTLCFAGGNVGNGPGWWVVLFSALLATAALALVWFALDYGSAITEQVTIERDPAAGLRLGGFLAACGLVLGRAVAGDWVSAAATARDLVLTGWPVLGLLVAALATEVWTRVKPERPQSSPFAQGILPALLYISLALLHALYLGRPA